MMKQSLYERVHSPQFDAVRGGKKTSGDVSDPTAKAVQMIADLDEKLMEKNNEIIEMNQRITRFIQEIPDPTIAKMIVLHYIQNLNWGKVCVRIYGYHNYHTCRKAVMRYFGKED
ncbi:MAG: hypothetical protein IKG39_05020 [Lachnospiraceae bacterium]|nr:hypothetical protein [Lachnospiraceae bacterium]